MATANPTTEELSLFLFNSGHGSAAVDDLVAEIKAVLSPDNMTPAQVRGIKTVLRTIRISAAEQVRQIKAALQSTITITPVQAAKIRKVLSTDGITGDQITGIRAILSSDVDTVQNAKHLFVLASDGISSRTQLNALKGQMGIRYNREYSCHKTVGIFQRRTEDNFNTTFLGNNDRAVFAKVTVPLDGGGVNVLLVAYHGPHKLKTDKKKDALRQLITYSDNLKQEKECQAVIIGGDFNLKMSIAKTATTNQPTLPDQRTLPDVRFSPLDANLASLLDYVIFWFDADVKLEVIDGHPKVLKWSDEKFGKIPPTYPNVVSLPRRAQRKCTCLEPFDHPRLLYKFKVSRPIPDTEVEELSAGLEGTHISE